MKLTVLVLGLAMAVVGLETTSRSQVLFARPLSVVRLRIEVNQQSEVLAAAVLVHRTDGPNGAVFYFLTSEGLLYPGSITPAQQTRPEGEHTVADPLPGIAVLRIAVAKSVLMPSEVVFDAPRQGAPFSIMCHSSAGEQVVVTQRVARISEQFAEGDRALPAATTCLGGPAYEEQGIFGITTAGGAGERPMVALLSAARGLLRRRVPELDTGPDNALTTGIGQDY